MKQINRRRFLATTLTGAAALSIPARSWSQVLGSADDIRVGVIGCGGRGQNHISGFTKMKGARVVGLCEADFRVLEKEQQKLKDRGIDVKGYTDLRRMLESKDIDVVSIATPNHWHSLASIWAVQAGTDVYVEKPVSHNVFEGRKLVEAARKYKKIVQTGTQSRSSHGIAECFAWLKEGNLGKMTLARGLCYKPRPSIGKVDGPQPVPAGVDYDLWCGPAPIKPVLRKQFHYEDRKSVV